MPNDSIQEAQENVAKLQDALDDAQRVLAAAERAQEAARRAHDQAEQHVTQLRVAVMAAIGVIAVAVMFGALRRRR